MYYTQDHDPAYNTHMWSRDPAYSTHTQSRDPAYNTHTRSHDPTYNMHTQSHDPAYNTHTKSQKCIRGVKMSNFGGLSVPVKEVMKKIVSMSLLYFYS